MEQKEVLHMRLLLKPLYFLLFTIRVLGITLLSLQYVLRIYIRKLFKRLDQDALSNISKRWAYFLNTILGVKVNRSGKIPETASLIIANHRSYIDILAINQLTACSFLAKKEVASWPLIGFLVRIVKTIFVDRNNSDSRHEARKQIKQRLEEGITTVIFPEGTSFSGPGILHFKTGSFVIATDLNIPIVPLAIEYKNKENAWVDDDTFFSHFYRTFSKPTTNVSIHISPPLLYDDPSLLKYFTRDCIKKSLKNYNREVTNYDSKQNQQEIYV